MIYLDIHKIPNSEWSQDAQKIHNVILSGNIVTPTIAWSRGDDG